MGVIRKPTVGKCYKHPTSSYAYRVTNVTDDNYEFIYLHSGEPDDTSIYIFKIDEFFEIELTELEEALL